MVASLLIFPISVRLSQSWVWLLGAVEHWNAEWVGRHVSKSGNRFEALQPVAMGLTEIFGGVGPDVARGLALRLDHGSQSLSDPFSNKSVSGA